ncbi:MAG: hypothetical protein WA919_21455 [Coleofasciculaceae cyanobacterium]
MAKNNRLRNILLGTGLAAAGAVGTKLAVDYFRNKGEEEAVDESEAIEESEEEEAAPISASQVAYTAVETSSVQNFLDASFGAPGRYKPTRAPKVFEYQGKQYMVIWAYDNEKDKNQMLAFLYTDEGRKMIASVGYTPDQTDYNLNLDSTPFAIEVNGEQITSGEGETDGTEEVDFVPVGS